MVDSLAQIQVGLDIVYELKQTHQVGLELTSTKAKGLFAEFLLNNYKECRCSQDLDQLRDKLIEHFSSRFKGGRSRKNRNEMVKTTLRQVLGWLSQAGIIEVSKSGGKLFIQAYYPERLEFFRNMVSMYEGLKLQTFSLDNFRYEEDYLRYLFPEGERQALVERLVSLRDGLSVIDINDSFRSKGFFNRFILIRCGRTKKSIVNNQSSDKKDKNLTLRSLHWTIRRFDSSGQVKETAYFVNNSYLNMPEGYFNTLGALKGLADSHQPSEQEGQEGQDKKEEQKGEQELECVFYQKSNPLALRDLDYYLRGDRFYNSNERIQGLYRVLYQKIKDKPNYPVIVGFCINPRTSFLIRDQRLRDHLLVEEKQVLGERLSDIQLIKTLIPENTVIGPFKHSRYHLTPTQEEQLKKLVKAHPLSSTPLQSMVPESSPLTDKQLHKLYNYLFGNRILVDELTELGAATTLIFDEALNEVYYARSEAQVIAINLMFYYRTYFDLKKSSEGKLTVVSKRKELLDARDLYHSLVPKIMNTIMKLIADQGMKSTMLVPKFGQAQFL